jgi:adenosine deaminase
MAPATPRTELHRHLDVSLRLSTLHALAQERGHVAASTSLAAFAQQIVIREPMKDLASVLGSFKICQLVLDRPEVLERVAFEACEDIRAEGTSAVELRYSPTFVGEFGGLSWNDQLDAFEAGIRRFRDGLAAHETFDAGLICIVSRDYGADSAEKAVDFFLENEGRFIGLDLAGNEIDFPNRLFEKPFARARAAGARITVHSGEALGPDTVWSAIEDLGARRIGHGIAAIGDPKLMEKLRAHDICLEVCPTSNWLTRVVPSLESHPLPKFLRAGVPVCINTDDPTLFGNSLGHEINISKQYLGLTDLEVARCFEHARRASFLPQSPCP